MTNNRAGRAGVGIAALATILGVAGIAPANAAKGNAERGAYAARTCVGCHGIPGYANAYPEYKVPKLGGQNAKYIRTALEDYRSGKRENAIMQAQAGALSEQEIRDIAAYFASIEQR